MLPTDPILADGFRARNRLLYRLDETHRDHEYVSDAMREEAKRINRNVEWMANDKAVLGSVLGRYEPRSVVTYGMIDKGEYVRISAPWQEVRDILADGGKVVAKPRFGSDGYGIVVFDDVVHLPMLMSLEGHVITAFVEQAGYAKAVWPGATNTIRVFTMHAPGEASFIAAAIHRFGTKDSSPTDNWEQGGMSVAINERTGILGHGWFPAISLGGPFWRHPDTGVKFRGMRVPGWDDVQSLVLEMAAEVHALAHIGWDIVVAEDGPVVLEMNANCGVCAIQVHGGLLRNPAVRAFYAAHEVRLPCPSTTTG